MIGEPSLGARLAAWGVHLFTALGLPLALLQVGAMMEGDAPRFFALNVVAMAIDSVDGTLARRLRVREVLPGFDGARLDDIVDFITYTFLPALALGAFHLAEGWWIPAAMVISSGYGFCQSRAKTEDSFVGFPSYWNVVVLYLFLLRPSELVSEALLAFLAVMVFVPIHYIYPSKARLMRSITIPLISVWTVLAVLLALRPEEPWSRPLAFASLFGPAWYTGLSFVHHWRIHRKDPA
jgi:phosphatidylcholine synthase